jgi:DNA-directed RNA polymerase specialized sigma24 family protein
MESLTSLVERARSGDLEAFTQIVCRFQAMAYGYAYAILGDLILAEDAAQEAFLEAHRKLDNLREPAAFPGWFRRIVFKH